MNSPRPNSRITSLIFDCYKVTMPSAVLQRRPNSLPCAQCQTCSLHVFLQHDRLFTMIQECFRRVLCILHIVTYRLLSSNWNFVEMQRERLSRVNLLAVTAPSANASETSDGFQSAVNRPLSAFRMRLSGHEMLFVYDYVRYSRQLSSRASLRWALQNPDAILDNNTRGTTRKIILMILVLLVAFCCF